MCSIGCQHALIVDSCYVTNVDFGFHVDESTASLNIQGLHFPRIFQGRYALLEDYPSSA
jgi:hypothetical protein